MAKPVTLCAGCGSPLTFMSTPNFGGGRLKDGGRVCRRCLARIVKVQPSFGLRSRKDHTTASMLQLLHPEQNIKEQQMAQPNYAPDKTLTNHLGGVVFLPRKVFDRCIAEQAKLRMVNMLDDLFAHPDEVWQLETDEYRQAWRHVKYYREGAFFGMVDTTRLDYLNIVDWYFLEDDPDAPDAARSAAIDAERTGKLIFSGSEGADPEAYDPVPILLDALQTGQDPEGALAAAQQAHARWWAKDCTDREYSHEELMALMDQRAFVLGSTATVYVWNKEFEIAARIQPEFIYNTYLWVDKRREVVELYLIHLLFHEQYARVEAIFADADFKKEFLDYYDLYRSVLDPHYEFQSKQDSFLASLNKVNHYCRQIGRKHLF